MLPLMLPLARIGYDTVELGSWIRTIRPGLAPSEQVVAIALRNTFPEFLATAARTVILVKFLREPP